MFPWLIHISCFGTHLEICYAMFALATRCHRLSFWLDLPLSNIATMDSAHSWGDFLGCGPLILSVWAGMRLRRESWVAGMLPSFSLFEWQRTAPMSSVYVWLAVLETLHMRDLCTCALRGQVWWRHSSIGVRTAPARSPLQIRKGCCVHSTCCCNMAGSLFFPSKMTDKYRLHVSFTI